VTAPPTLEALRARVELALRDDDAWEVLEAAIALWRAAPRVEVASVVDGLDRVLVDALPRESAPSVAELRAAVDARARGALLRALFHEPIAGLAARLDEAAAWRDPRVVTAATNALLSPKRRARLGPEGFAAVEKALRDGGDARAFGPLRSLRHEAPPWSEPAAWDERFAALGAHIEARARATPPLDGETRAVVAALGRWWTERRRLRPWRIRQRPAERRFWAGVEAAPRDLQHRQVLADALSEAGDARGELLVRACRGEAIPAAELAAAWLGPVAPSVRLDYGLEFDGGLLDRVVLAWGFSGHFDHPLWRTVRAVDLTNGRFSVNRWPGRELPCLEEVKGLSHDGFLDLLASGPAPSLVAAEVHLFPIGLPRPEAAAGAGAPRLERLTVQGWGAGGPDPDPLEALLDPIIAGPVGARLRSLTLIGELRFARWQVALAAAGAPLEELVVDGRSGADGPWCRTEWRSGALRASVKATVAPPDRWWTHARRMLELVPSEVVTGPITLATPDAPLPLERAQAAALVRARFRRATALAIVDGQGQPWS